MPKHENKFDIGFHLRLIMVSANVHSCVLSSKGKLVKRRLVKCYNVNGKDDKSYEKGKNLSGSDKEGKHSSGKEVFHEVGNT
jgi:hypothetical protein